MNFVWQDYNPETMRFVENWLDESAVKSTGLDEGFRAFYEYWANEDGFVVGGNFWCKVVGENDMPFGIIAFSQYEDKITIMEIVIAPEYPDYLLVPLNHIGNVEKFKVSVVSTNGKLEEVKLNKL